MQRDFTASGSGGISSSSQGMRTYSVNLPRSPFRLSEEQRANTELGIHYRARSTLITEAVEDIHRVIPEEDRTIIQEDLSVTWHTEPLNQLLVKLGTSQERGLDDIEAAKRLLSNGSNTINLPRPNAIVANLKHLWSGFCPLLWVACVMFILCWRPLGDPNPQIINLAIGILIVIIIFLQAAFNAYQESKSNKVMDTINKMLPSAAQVMRSGVLSAVPTNNLVVGDIVTMSIGDKVPADMRLLQVDQLKVDKSMLTGESEPVSSTLKSTDSNYLETKNLVFLGSNVVEGQGVGVVVATGNRTTMGKITMLAAADQGTSKLQKEITHFVLIIVVLSIVTGAACILFWVGFLRNEFPSFLTISGVLATALSAIVAYVPEGLPVCVTLTLTIVAKQMYQNNALVKNLPTIETLGTIDVLASDKTGTLTQNKMSVVHLSTKTHGEELMDTCDAAGLPTKQCLQLVDDKEPAFTAALTIASLCNRASWVHDDINLTISERRATGDASDVALLRFATLYTAVETIRARSPKIAEIPFNSKNKWALSVHEDNNDQNSYFIAVKGAAEIMILKCVSYVDINNSEVTLESHERHELLLQQERLCDMGERVLALCYFKLSKKDYNITQGCDLVQMDLPMDRLVFVALVGLIDPPRPDVKDAVAICRNAGIRVIMVTGDHPGTAAAIAKMVGIITTNTAPVIANSHQTFDEDPRHHSFYTEEHHLNNLPGRGRRGNHHGQQQHHHNHSDRDIEMIADESVVVRGIDLPAGM